MAQKKTKGIVGSGNKYGWYKTEHGTWVKPIENSQTLNKQAAQLEKPRSSPEHKAEAKKIRNMQKKMSKDYTGTGVARGGKVSKTRKPANRR